MAAIREKIKNYILYSIIITVKKITDGYNFVGKFA